MFRLNFYYSCVSTCAIALKYMSKARLLGVEDGLM